MYEVTFTHVKKPHERDRKTCQIWGTDAKFEPAQGPDYDLIVFVENATQSFAGYSLVDSLELTGLVWTPPEVLDDVTVTYILDQCERNASIWELVKLEFTEVNTLVESLPATISNFTDQINDFKNFFY